MNSATAQADRPRVAGQTDDWLLLRQQAPILAHGRCFGRGDVRTESGALVASYAQEALLRFRR